MTAEDREAIAFVEAVRRQWPTLLMIHIANEGGNRGQHPGYHAKRARMGVVKGTPDYFVAEPVAAYHGLFLELKARGGRLKPEQSSFCDEARLRSYVVAVAWGWQAALKALTAYLGGTSGLECVHAYLDDGYASRPMEDVTLTGGVRRGKTNKTSTRLSNTELSEAARQSVPLVPATGSRNRNSSRWRDLKAPVGL